MCFFLMMMIWAGQEGPADQAGQWEDYLQVQLECHINCRLMETVLVTIKALYLD